MAKKKHQPPAKVNYDKTHPIVSIRVDQELKKKLEEIKQISGKSVGDVLREALEVQLKSTKQAFVAGRTSGRSIYGVEYKCSVCGGTIWITSEAAKKAAAEFMRKSGWHHGECVNK